MIPFSVFPMASDTVQLPRRDKVGSYLIFSSYEVMFYSQHSTTISERGSPYIFGLSVDANGHPSGAALLVFIAFQGDVENGEHK